MNFGWDDLKADLNLKKHNVTFEEATSVFDDPLAKVTEDELHSNNELRETLVGYSLFSRLLVVAYTERNHVIRIISAREATKTERVDYEENN